jgi:hypothetical protein
MTKPGAFANHLAQIARNPEWLFNFAGDGGVDEFNCFFPDA